jgi:hypothetical protein
MNFTRLQPITPLSGKFGISLNSTRYKRSVRIYLEKKGFEFVTRLDLVPKKLKLNLNKNTLLVVCDPDYFKLRDQLNFAKEVKKVLLEHPSKKFRPVVKKGLKRYRVEINDLEDDTKNLKKVKKSCTIFGKPIFQ